MPRSSPTSSRLPGRHKLVATNIARPTALPLILLSLGLAAPAAHAQVFEIDTTGTTVFADAEAFADGPFPFMFPNMIYGACPLQPAPPPPPPNSDVDRKTANSFSKNWVGSSGVVHDFGADATPHAREAFLDPISGFLFYVNGSTTAVVTIDGNYSKQLTIKIRVNTINDSFCGDNFFARACATVMSQVTAQIVNLPPGRPVRVGYEWTSFGQAIKQHECPLPDACNDCNGKADEDPATAFGAVTMDIGGQGPGLVTSALYTNLIPGIATSGSSNGEGQVNIFPTLGQLTIPVGLGLSAQSDGTIDYPGKGTPPFALIDCGDDGGGSEYLATLTLTIRPTLVNTSYIADYMRPVLAAPPGLTNGPSYDFRTGRYEITNALFATFLNDAQADGGNTQLGANLSFKPNGKVTSLSGHDLFVPSSVQPSSRIDYDASAALGNRYSVAPAFAQRAVGWLTWSGAAKFCNWLTLEMGFGVAERCYVEGASAYDFRPVTIGAADWVVRDLNGVERSDLVTNYDGFRLPMDDCGFALGYLGDQDSSFNEWYAATAYDPAAPATARFGSAGEVIPPYHWRYGFGRDAIAGADANFVASGDPFDNDTAPVGYYNGINLLTSGASTKANDNPWDIYDLSGNVFEWGQDYAVSPGNHAMRSGSWTWLSDWCSATYRAASYTQSAGPNLGFRVTQRNVSYTAPCPADLNYDGTVDMADLQFLRLSYGPCPGCEADLNRDGVVDKKDANILRQAFGQCP